MTIPVALEPTVWVSRRRRLAARIAVVIAGALVRLSPLRLRQVLQVVSRGARAAAEPQALAARQAVVSVSVACAGQGCLQRSVATALLCRLGGTWPDWCTGIRTEPFRAHAWVEVDGTPVGEGQDVPHFQKIMSVPAPRRAAGPDER